MSNSNNDSNNDKHIPDIKFKHVFTGFSGELEKIFFNNFCKDSLNISRIALIVCFVLYAIFAFLDLFTLPLTKKISWLIRFAIVCPVSLLCFILSFVDVFKKYMQLLLSVTSIIGGFGIIAMIFFADKSEYGYTYYFTGILLILLWTYALARLRFINASVISWIITLFFEIIVFYKYLIEYKSDFIHFFVTINFFFISANIIGMFANFTIEYYLRSDFLLRNKLIYSKKVIEEEKKSKIDFFIKIAHETKTPLTLIINYLENYIKEAGNNPKLFLIKKNLDKLSRDIINFLDIEKLEKNIDIYDHNQIFNLSVFLEEKIALFNEIAQRNDIKIINNINRNIFIKADSVAIDRIINNILDNALKYNKVNGIININLYTLNNLIYIEVSDTGIGIDNKYLDEIFLPYFQVNKKHNYSDGIGMGLSIVKKIIENINGKIDIQSEIDKGTKITIQLPEHKISDYDLIEENILPSDPIDNYPTFKNIKIKPFDKDKNTLFIVEDNKDMIYFLKLALEEQYNFYFALDGKDALEKLNNIPKPDLIISDIMMENMDGFQFLQNLSAINEYRSIPIIFLTARTTIDDKVTGLNAGAISYIYKPFAIDELKAKIKAIINKKNSILQDMKDKIFNAIYNNKNYIHKEDHDSLITKICVDNNLSNREKKVLLLLIDGNSYKEISKELFISIHTVKSHVHKIYEKLKVKNRNELLGLIKIF